MTEHAEQTDPAGTQRGAKRVLLIALTMLAAVALFFVGGVYLLTEKYLGDVQRLPDPFAGIPADERPVKPATGSARRGETWLLAGLDTRSPVPTTGAKAQ